MRAGLNRLVANSLRRIYVAICLSGAIAANGVGLSYGQEPSAATLQQPLADAALVASKDYAPITAAQVESARSQAQAGVQRLTAFLKDEAPGRFEGWRAFLDLDGLQEELDGRAMPNLQRITRIYGRLTSGEPGLELDAFRDAAESLRPLLERLQLRESDTSRLPDAKSQFVQAVDALERFLKTGAAEKEQGWKEFLRWDDLKELADADEIDAREAGRSLALFEGQQAGLERFEFRRVARTLRKYIEITQLARQTSGAERYQRRLEQLAEAIKDYQVTASNDSFAVINSTLLWLQQIERQPQLVSSFRSEFNRPNIFLGISDRFIAQQLNDPVDRCEPVVRCFEGSTVRACAKTCGELTAILQPCDTAAMIQLNFQGTIHSRGTAQKRKVYVGNSNRTEICAVKNLILAEEGICDSPACCNACTVSKTCGICVDRRCGTRLISRLAKRKANESRGRAENFASNDACCTLRKRMNQEAADNLAKTNPQLAELRQQLRDNDVYPDSVKIFSTASEIHIDSKSLSRMGLAAAAAPPAAVPAGDIVVQAHQAIVNDVLTERLGGIKIDNQTIVTLLEKYKVPVPEELKKGSKISMKTADGTAAEGQTDSNDEEADSDEAWAMTFDRDLPATVSFDEGKIRIGVRGRKFARGDQTINERINISAAYKILRDEKGDVSLEREGDVLVEFVNSRDRLSTRQLSYKVFLERKFGAMFQAKISKDQLPKSEASAQIEKFKVESIDTQKGWFLAGVTAKEKLQPREE